MRWLLLLGLFPCLAPAADTWEKFISGPFEVFTDAGPQAGREATVRFEQFRQAVGVVLGAQNLTTPEPVRIFVFKNAMGWTDGEPVAAGRNCYAIALDEKAAVPPAVYRALAGLLIETNTTRIPAAYERGLMKFFSTFQVAGIRITVGAPPPDPDLDWARVHLLITDPGYFGEMGVLLYNLRNGVEEDVSYRNAFGKSRTQVETEAATHLALGGYRTTTLPSRAMSQRNLPERPVSDADARLARADMLAGAQSAAEYQALIKAKIKTAEAAEGLGLLALRDGRTDEARQRFSAAVDAGSASARCYIEYAKLEPDRAKAETALLKALGINSKLDEPFALLAARDTDPQKRLAHWKAAAERNPRNASYWKALAECYLAEHNYADAAKAWSSGEQAATDPAERQRMHEARMAIESERLDYEAAERKRRAEEDARDIERLKAEALERIHAAEARINQGAPPLETKPVPWWDGPAPSGKVAGSLTQVDCLGARTRLTVQTADRKTVRLLVIDASKVAINQPGKLELACGVQKARKVVIEYFPKVDARLTTAGEVASIEFQ